MTLTCTNAQGCKKHHPFEMEWQNILKALADVLKTLLGLELPADFPYTMS